MKIFIVETVLLSMVVFGDAKPKQVRRRRMQDTVTSGATTTSVTTTGTSPITVYIDCPVGQYTLFNATSNVWSCETREMGADGRTYSKTGRATKAPKSGKSGGGSGATAKADPPSSSNGNNGSDGLPDKFHIQCPQGYVAEYVPIPHNYWTCTPVTTTSTNTNP